MRFTGAAGAVIRREGELHLFLLEGESIEADGISLASTVTPVSFYRSNQGDVTVEAEGPGTVCIGFPFKQWVRVITGGTETEAGTPPTGRYIKVQMPTRMIDGRVMLLMDDGSHTFTLRPH